MQLPVTKPHPSVLRPHDAATLILVRRDGAEPRILMGKRHDAHKFMPGKFVFPGGRVDPADKRLPVNASLMGDVEAKLLAAVKGSVTPQRACGIALAAVRETFEEVGFVIGTKQPAPRTRSTAWQQFFATGHIPDLSGLRLLARAVTPPGRPRRFDTRFFTADANCICNLDTPVATDTNELLEAHWVTLQQARALELPWITGQILNRLETELSHKDALRVQRPVTYQFMRGKNWQYQSL